ncbi:MAG: homocysteine S-methyltransferase family protein [Blautia sp.]
MTKKEFQNLAKQRPIILDGATGSNLMKAGMPRGVCTEQWICENPKPLQELQRAYEKAGSQVVYAPTFSANRISLKNYGLENQVAELNKALIEISRTAVGSQVLVAGDLTTAGKQEIPYEELWEAYREQIVVQTQEGVDLLVAETMLGVTECMAVLDAAASVCNLPVMCTLTVESDGSLFFGGNIYEAVETLEEMGADAVGINCSTGPDQLLSVVENMRKRVSIPLIVKPNAGMPIINEQGQPVYSMGAKEFADCMKRLVQAGADIIGGCCGTTPEYIEKLHNIFLAHI